MSTPTENLVDRLTDATQSGLDATVLVPLLRRLARGEPVEVSALAAEAGLKPVVKMDWLRAEDLIPVPVDPNWTGPGR